MRFYLAIAFSVLAIALAVAPYVPQAKRRLPQAEWLAPLVPACIFLAALLSPQPVSHFYKGAVLLGLLITTLAALFHALPGMPAYVPIAHFFLIVPLYLIAFASAHRLALPTVWGLAVIVWAAVLMWQVRKRPLEERSPLFVLVGLAGLMLWQALEMWVQSGQVWSIFGVGGAALLAVSGTLLLIHNMITPIRGGAHLAVAAFVLSQGLIAWSAWGLG